MVASSFSIKPARPVHARPPSAWYRAPARPSPLIVEINVHAVQLQCMHLHVLTALTQHLQPAK